MTLIDLSIQDFTQTVASASPAPGGGSIAALCGVLGAALVHMVAGLSMGEKKYQDVEPLMMELSEKSNHLQKKLLELVEKDTFAYNQVLKAYALPKDTPAKTDLRVQAIEDALKKASTVPFQTLETAAAIMDMVEGVIKNGNSNCLTDAGVAAEVIAAAVQGSAYNVYVNLMDIKDEVFSLDLKQKVQIIRNDIQDKTKRLRKTIEQSINMES